MKKRLTLLFSLIGIAVISSGQTKKSYSDDFESYSNNAWLSQISSTPWETWSGNPSTNNDDVRVTNSDAYSGSKSIYFNAGPGPEDIVLPFGGLYDTGQFVYRAMMKVPNNKTAYFNFQGAVSVGTTWAVEVALEDDGDLVFSNQGSGTMFQTTYPQGQWFQIKVYVNITKNEWHVFIDDDYKGRFFKSINRVSYLNLYPANNSASFWVDDVSFEYASPIANNAGIELLSSPVNAICGSNDIKVKVVNNGINVIDSVRINWSVDGVLQKPVFVKSKIDTNTSSTGNSLVVTLDSTHNLKLGLRRIKAWTSFPNGKADTINFDDTLRTNLMAEIRGISLVTSTPFQGSKGAGTAAWPRYSLCGRHNYLWHYHPNGLQEL